MRTDKSDDQHLVAYLVLKQGYEPTAGELRAYMKDKLPDYMLPQSFVMLDALPLTPNGKVARDRLPDVERLGDGARASEYVAPTNPTELQLAQIWEDLFKRRPIGIRDDFFDLGGHSILALRLMARVQKRFGRELPLATLFAEPTIEKLARVIGKQTDDSSWSPLVAIQPAGPRPPFFCVHPSGGNVLCYVGLSRHLGAERPFYGLQDPPSFDGSRETSDNIEAMAARYLEVMREVQPGGPYFLGGYSFGGVVAFEMAQQLRRLNLEVSLLALIDTAIPQSTSRLYELQDLLGVDDGLMLAIEINEQAQQAGVELRVSLADIWRLPPRERVSHAFEQGRAAHLWPPEISLADVQHYLRLHKARRRAIQTYEPQLYGGRLTLLRTAEATFDNLDELEAVADAELLRRLREEETTTFRNPTLGWEKFSEESINIQFVAGDHHSMLSEPHVQVLAERLRASLEKTEKE
jgi:thioesterase domain-containing protein/acyl carrier protein